MDISGYVKEGSYSRQALHETIQLYIDEIKNTVMRQLACGTLEGREKDFFEYPATTRNRHDSYVGLVTHILGMLQLAEQLCHLYPVLDRGLLYSGVILHDIGKTVELSGVTVSEYITQGKLLGYISTIQAEILAKAEQLGLEDCKRVMLLRHMILPHHGVHKYGSPVLLVILETEILYMIDSIDAHMNTLHKALEPVQAGEFI